MVMLIHAANLLYLASYFARDGLRLRVLAVVAGLCVIPYLLLHPVPLVAAAAWNAFFVAVNSWWAVRILRDRRRRATAQQTQTAAFDVARMAGRRWPRRSSGLTLS